MSHIRAIGATTALAAAGLMILSSVAVAHDGPLLRTLGGSTTGGLAHRVLTATSRPARSRDLIIGLAGNDKLEAGDRRDVIRGNRGNDAIDGGAGSDRIRGGLGDDRLAGGDGPDKILGGPGADGINGQAGHDRIKAGRGADLIIANDGVRDWISCGPGKDRVKADRRDRVSRDCERVVRVSPTVAD